MKRILTLLLVSIGYFAAAQTQPTLPPGSQIYSSNLFLAPDSTVWTGKAGLYINLGSKRIFDQLLAAKVDTAALNSYYTKAQVDAFLLLKEDLANKVTDLTDPNDTTYPTTKAVKDAIDAIPPTDLSNYYDKDETDDLLDTKIDTALLDKPNGIPLMDANGKIKIVNIPDQLIGAVNYQGTWSPATNTPALPAVPGPETKGHYYVASDSAEFQGNVYRPNDWIISSGSEWQIIEATNYVRRVNGQTGDVVITAADIGAVQTLSQPSLGQLAISEGNTVDLTNLKSASNNDYSSFVGNGFYVGNTNSGTGFPTVSGNYLVRRGSSAQTSFGLFKSSLNDGVTYIQSGNSDWAPIATLDKTVNMSGNQTGIAGNKTWTGTQFIEGSGAGGQLLRINSNSPTVASGGAVFRIVNSQTGNLFAGNAILIETAGKQAFRVNGAGDTYVNGGMNVTGSTILSALSGTGNGIVGVNASGTLTRRPESDVIQTLSLGSGAGNIAISGGNSVNLRSLGYDNMGDEVDFTTMFDALPFGMSFIHAGPNSTGFPVESASGSRTLGLYFKHSLGQQRSSFAIAKGYASNAENKLYFNTGSSSGTGWNGWETFLSEELAETLYAKPADIGDGTLSLATGTGLTGSASFSANQSGNATFTVEAASGYTIPTTAQATNWTTAYDYSEIGHIPLSQKGANNGVATLNAGGVIPWEQLPTSNPYKGTWDASSNTPTIADGTGTAGDYYRVNVAGTQDLGSGNITFAVGDDVIYSGTVWQRVPGGAVASNLGIGDHDGSTLQITNSNGTGLTIPAATSILSGLMSAADKVLIGTAVQPGDDISDLNNDAGFIATGTGDAQVRTNLQLDARYAQLSGATFTGPVLWSTAPTLDAHLANKKYVDDAIGDIPPATATRLRGETTGTYEEGDLTLLGDGVISILQNGTDFTFSADLSNYLQIGANISELVNDLSYTAAGSNITLFNNNAGYIVGGTAADQVRTNADLDGRYIQTELDPSVPQHVKDISSSDLSNWNSKISSVTGGTGITVDATDPYNLIISASAQSLIFTGDVTGAGTGTIELTLANDSVKTQHLADTSVTNAKLAVNAVDSVNIIDGAVISDKIDEQAVTTAKLADTAVTTAKLRDKAVTLDKVQQILQGHVIGAPGAASNPWYLIEGTSWGFSEWADYFAYSPVGRHCHYEGRVYRSRIDNNLNNRPDISPSAWEDVGAWKGFWPSPNATFLEQEFEPGDVAYLVGNPGYTDFAGLLKTDVEVTGLVPGAPLTPEYVDAEMLKFGEGFLIEDNEIKIAGANSITGLILPGSNITITGTGTTGSPYYISSTAGGAGSSTLAGLTDVSVNAATNGDVLGYVDGLWVATPQTSYTLPTATTSLLGGIKLGSNTVQSVAANAPSSEAGKTYPVQLNSSGQAVVNVPWESGGYTLPIASPSVLGGIRIGSGLSIDGAGVVSVTGGGGSDFRLRSGTNAYLSNDVTLLAGTNVTLSQAGQNITINATGGGISALTGDVLASGTGSVAATIANGAVTNAKMANMAANTFKGRLASSGTPQDLTANQMRLALSTTAANTTTTIDMSGARLQRLNAISANTTYTLTNNVDGANVQCTVYNSGSNTVQVNVTGAIGLGDTTIPAGKAAVMSITNFGDGQVRYTIVTEN